ncbi:MAG TPA: hypothetical protein VJS67_04175 [Pseudonocardiaceae bacterium]|nr:hypothetical protein [Pseudonocardiaceae bacterium]
MRWAYRGRKVLAAVPDEPQSRVAVGLDHQGVCPASRDGFDSDISYRITRTEIMDYLSQTYGPVFVQDLMKHLPSSGDDMNNRAAWQWAEQPRRRTHLEAEIIAEL